MHGNPWARSLSTARRGGASAGLELCRGSARFLDGHVIIWWPLVTKAESGFFLKINSVIIRGDTESPSSKIKHSSWCLGVVSLFCSGTKLSGGS